jgi:hypothetical protein
MHRVGKLRLDYAAGQEHALVLGLDDLADFGKLLYCGLSAHPVLRASEKGRRVLSAVYQIAHDKLVEVVQGFLAFPWARAFTTRLKP